MTDTTTIEITEPQRERLAEIAHGDESVKSVVQRLLDNYDADRPLDELRVRELAREEITDRVVGRALE